jgi:hypothetical protein
MEWQQVGEIAEWEATIAMTSGNGFIWSVKKTGRFLKLM